MKPFKTIDEQLDLLKSRHLCFEDDNEAKKYLLRNNYYLVINCYSKFFIAENGNYIENTYFKEIVNVHIFDKEIRNNMLKCILEIEKHFRAIISHVFCESYREPYSYLIASNYRKNEVFNVSQTISQLSSTLKKYINSDNNNSIKHYHNKHKDVPLWVLSSYINFGTIIAIYRYMKDSDRNKVAKEFSNILNENLSTTNAKISAKDLQTIFNNIHEVRNILAHSNKIINFKCKSNYPYISVLHSIYNIEANTPKQDIYNTFIIMRALIEQQTYAIMHNSIRKRAIRLRKLINTINSNVILRSFGFPDDWDVTVEKMSQI